MSDHVVLAMLNYSHGKRDHIAQLRRGVAAWNAWRRENPDISPDHLGPDGVPRASVNGGFPMLGGVRLSEAADVRFWHKADITAVPIHVRFWG
jgi:hypothetical protein